MNGIEALKAMSEGKVIVQMRDHRPGMKSHNDTFYKYRAEHTDYSFEDGYIWCRNRNEWAWHKCSNPAEFWMRTFEEDTFEIVEGEGW